MTTALQTPHPGPEATGPVRIELMFPTGTSFHADWEAKWRRGERPSRWPYGLEELAHYADEVRFVLVERPRRWRRMIRPLTDRLAGRALGRRPGRDIGVTWDENVAIRMVTRRRHAEMYSGAIWIADRVDRDEKEFADLFVGALAELTGVWTLSRPQLEPTRAIIGDGPRLEFSTFGVNEEFFTPRPLPDEPCVLSIGTDRDRDWDTLLAAYAIVHREMPHVRLRLQAEAQVAVPDYVEVLPRMEFDELREVYAQASVVAVALRHNLHVSGMTVSIEARATGRPVVISRTVGMEDFMTDGLDVRHVEIGDAEAMAREIMALLEDREAARAMGEAGRREVEERFTSRHLAADLARLMRLERRATPGRLVDGGTV